MSHKAKTTSILCMTNHFLRLARPQRLQKSVESSKQVLPKLFLIKSEKNTKILLHSHFMNKRLTKINPSCIKEMSFHKKYFVIYTQKRKYNNKSSQEKHNRQQIISFIRSLALVLRTRTCTNRTKTFLSCYLIMWIMFFFYFWCKNGVWVGKEHKIMTRKRTKRYQIRKWRASSKACLRLSILVYQQSIWRFPGK